MQQFSILRLRRALVIDNHAYGPSMRIMQFEAILRKCALYHVKVPNNVQKRDGICPSVISSYKNTLHLGKNCPIHWKSDLTNVAQYIFFPTEKFVHLLEKKCPRIAEMNLPNISLPMIFCSVHNDINSMCVFTRMENYIIYLHLKIVAFSSTSSE